MILFICKLGGPPPVYPVSAQQPQQPQPPLVIPLPASGGQQQPPSVYPVSLSQGM